MIDNELAFAPETSTGLLPSSGDDSVSLLEPGVLDNNSTSALSDPFSQDVSELSETYESSDNSLASENLQLADTTATETDPLTGNTAVGAATPETLYEFNSEPVTVDDADEPNITKTVTLDYIETIPSNIELQEHDDTVPEVSDSVAPAAINGGFFNLKNNELLSIAVNDDQSVDIDDFGRSNYYGNRPRGTLYWDGATNTTGVWPVSTVEDLTDDPERISDLDDYWAQGGISMGLKLPEVEYGLPQQTIEEIRDLENPGEFRISPLRNAPRTAMIHDNLSNNGTGETGSKVYLITTQDPVTMGEFREAIKQEFTDPEGVERGNAEVDVEGGIFLDSGSSTQIKTDSSFDDYSNDGREIPQIVALKDI